MEHAVSDEVLDRLDALLGHLRQDPHGDPIPSRAGKIDSQVYATLATCATGRRLRIVRVTEQSEEFLRFAEGSGLRPGAELSVTERNLVSGLVALDRPDGGTVALEIRRVTPPRGPLTGDTVVVLNGRGFVDGFASTGGSALRTKKAGAASSAVVA